MRVEIGMDEGLVVTNFRMLSDRVIINIDKRPDKDTPERGTDKCNEDRYEGESAICNNADVTHSTQQAAAARTPITEAWQALQKDERSMHVAIARHANSVKRYNTAMANAKQSGLCGF